MIQVVDNGECFVCGQSNRIGLRAVFEVDPEKGTSRSRLTIPADFQGWQEVVHGGVIAALLDEAGIYACRTRGDRFVTAEISVKYRKPVSVGWEISVGARLVDRTKRIFHVKSWIEREGQVLAEADSKIFFIE